MKENVTIRLKNLRKSYKQRIIAALALNLVTPSEKYDVLTMYFAIQQISVFDN